MSGFLDSGNKADCTACGACVQKCTHHAIIMEEDEHGFVFPKIVDSRCTHCGLCKKTCPVDNSSLQFHPSSEGTAIAGFAKDEAVRAASSSGGFFTGIAEAFWKEGETVAFGAEMLPDLSVAHTRADTFHDIAKFRTSKYARSDTGTTFAETKALLAEGRRVLYSGTPCQIAGLLTFLGGEPENLLTVDLVCHGYFSPLFLRKERAFLEQKNHAKAVRFEFRNKDGGHWRDFKSVWHFENGSTVVHKKSEIPYLQIWTDHLISRDSCHTCRFAYSSRIADITLADFWHVKTDSPLFGGNKGTSAVFVNSSKGHAIIDSVISIGRYVQLPVDRERLCKVKIALHGPPPANPKRERALKDLNRLPYRRFCRKWIETSRPSIIRRIVRRLRRIIINRLNPK